MIFGLLLIIILPKIKTHHVSMQSDNLIKVQVWVERFWHNSSISLKKPITFIFSREKKLEFIIRNSNDNINEYYHYVMSYYCNDNDEAIFRYAIYIL